MLANWIPGFYDLQQTRDYIELLFVRAQAFIWVARPQALSKSHFTDNSSHNNMLR